MGYEVFRGIYGSDARVHHVILEAVGKSGGLGLAVAVLQEVHPCGHRSDTGGEEIPTEKPEENPSGNRIGVA